MQEVYFVANGIEVWGSRERGFEDITQIGEKGYSRLWLLFTNDTGITNIEINLSRTNGEISSLTFVGCKKIFYYNKPFNADSFCKKSMQSAIMLNDYVENNKYPRYITTPSDVSVEVYSNAVVFWVKNEQIAPRYLFYESEYLGVLTDKNFIVVAFVTWNLSEKELEDLKWIWVLSKEGLFYRKKHPLNQLKVLFPWKIKVAF